MEGNFSDPMPAPASVVSQPTGDDSSDSISVEEPTSTEWTDEKHSLYLKSMEASFVNQLYKHDHFPVDWADWNPQKIRNPIHRSHRSGGRVFSGHFKVFRDNCWKVVNFKTNRPDLSIENDFLGGAWVQHFRAAHILQDTKSKEEAAISLRRKRKTHYYGIPANSKGPLDTAEVSDQNFVNEDPEEESLALYAAGGKGTKIGS
ncbi:cold-regulated protein 27-like isoform X2 [Malania oleifera]|uniref:cold-regulated protein 27-like isoform X2 n=1 Tax=Malania oleifera TaxID=397392 RepID=UPI0025ADFC1F|nr:cold-regulated protein 27-like isoform X2 [Malania oleifera]